MRGDPAAAHLVQLSRGLQIRRDSVASVAGEEFRSQCRAIRWQIRLPDALVRSLLQFRRPRAADFRMLLHWLKDPLVFALVALGYQQRWRLPLFEKIMTGAKCAA